MENSLIHYGVLGMKWGVRRTPAQLARARGKTKTKSEETSKKVTSSSTSAQKKSISEMSDDELRRTVSRLQLEQQYRNLNPERVSVGRKFANKVLKDVVVPAATEVARNKLKDVMTDALNSASKKKKK